MSNAIGAPSVARHGKSGVNPGLDACRRLALELAELGAPRLVFAPFSPADLTLRKMGQKIRGKTARQPARPYRIGATARRTGLSARQVRHALRRLRAQAKATRAAAEAAP